MRGGMRGCVLCHPLGLVWLAFGILLFLSLYLSLSLSLSFSLFLSLLEKPYARGSAPYIYIGFYECFSFLCAGVCAVYIYRFSSAVSFLAVDLVALLEKPYARGSAPYIYRFL